MLSKASAWLERAAFKPDSLSDDLVTMGAFLPPVAAALLLFRLPALEMLGIAVAIGALGHAGARLMRQRLSGSPIFPALIGAGLVGAGSPVVWAAAIAVAAVALELVRARLLPGMRVQTGLLAYVVVLLGSGDAPAVYLQAITLNAGAEPIRLWLGYFDAAGAPLDAVRLYVGNVAGPVLATSLLAVAIGSAWLWYARRLSAAAVAGALVGALLPAMLMRWDAVFQLDSGPLWFACALLLADTRMLPRPRHLRVLMGFAAGLTAVAFRTRGYGIEGALTAVLAIQLAVALTHGAVWLLLEQEKVRESLRRLRTRSSLQRVSRSKASGA